MRRLTTLPAPRHIAEPKTAEPKVVAKIATSGEGAADPTWNPRVSGEVYVLATTDKHLYLGGRFTSIGGQSRTNLAKVRLSGVAAMDAFWNPNPNGPVDVLAINDEDVFAAGDFSAMGGERRYGIALLPESDRPSTATRRRSSHDQDGPAD